MQIQSAILQLCRFLAVGLAAYILTYAPFVRLTAPNHPVTGSFLYRTPLVYRPVEWLTLNTSTRWGSPLLTWSSIWGARNAAELQTWFYAQHVEDPEEMSVNWQFPD